MSVPVAITGLGVVSAFGHGVESFWRALTAGESGLRPIDRFPVAPGTAPAAAVRRRSSVPSDIAWKIRQ